ncbi:MAG: hypothetical protein K2F95_01810 [Alistipes sp.]|nr:hypothetical protein [Alistipes sp.]
MKKLLVSFFSVISVLGVSAQDMTAYFVEGSTFRSQLNPALAPLKGYINIPLVGSIQAGVNGNIPIGALLFDNGGSLTPFTDSGISAEAVLGRLSANNDLNIGSRIGLIGLGRYTSKGHSFWSFDLALNIDAEINAPRELFSFLKGGEAADIRDLHVSLKSYADVSFNYSFRVAPCLYLGLRAKFVSGLLGADFALDRFDVSVGSERWYADVAGSIEMNGISEELQPGDCIYLDELTDYIDLSSLARPAGYGGAIDIGATYDLTGWLQLSASVNDLGFVKWGNGSTRRFTFEQSVSSDDISIVDGKIEYPEDINFDGVQLNVVEGSGSTQRLTTRINVGADFELLDHRLGFGVLYNARICPNKTYHTLMGSVNIHPLRWIGLTAAYSVIDNKAGAVSFALNICPSWINLYVATDVLLGSHVGYMIPDRGSKANVTFGLAIPMGRWGARRFNTHRSRGYL